MRWECGDGTEVELGGKVAGASALAERLRKGVARTRAGNPEPLLIGMQPGGFRQLDLDDPQLVNFWVRYHAGRFSVPVVSAPEVEPYEDNVEDDGTAGPNAIF